MFGCLPPFHHKSAAAAWQTFQEAFYTDSQLFPSNSRLPGIVITASNSFLTSHRRKYLSFFSGRIFFTDWIYVQISFRGEYFTGVNILQGWIFYRVEYFTGLNIVQRWIFYRGEYFSDVTIFLGLIFVQIFDAVMINQASELRLLPHTSGNVLRCYIHARSFIIITFTISSDIITHTLALASLAASASAAIALWRWTGSRTSFLRFEIEYL